MGDNNGDGNTISNGNSNDGHTLLGNSNNVMTQDKILQVLAQEADAKARERSFYLNFLSLKAKHKQNRLMQEAKDKDEIKELILNYKNQADEAAVTASEHDRKNQANDAAAAGSKDEGKKCPPTPSPVAKTTLQDGTTIVEEHRKKPPPPSSVKPPPPSSVKQTMASEDIKNGAAKTLTPKRKPGRPKKAKPQDGNSLVTSEDIKKRAAKIVTPKRKPDRPKKAKSQDGNSLVTSEDIKKRAAKSMTTNRKPGRPKKAKPQKVLAPKRLRAENYNGRKKSKTRKFSLPLPSYKDDLASSSDSDDGLFDPNPNPNPDSDDDDDDSLFDPIF